MTDSDRCVLTGTWTYEGSVECRVEIWRTNLRPGSKDPDDPPEFRDDQPGEWYEVLFEPAGGGRIGQAGGGWHETLELACTHVRLVTHGTVVWRPR